MDIFLYAFSVMYSPGPVNFMGLNAGLGNLGVSVMQFAVPMVITSGVFGALGGEAQIAAKTGTKQ